MVAYIRRILTHCVKAPSVVRRGPARRTVLRVTDLEDRATPATFTVTNVGDNSGLNPAPNAGTGTLRQAMVDANANTGLDTIVFSLPAGVQTIPLLAALPAIAQDLTITNSTGATNLIIQRSAAATGNFGLLSITGGTGVTIDGVTLTGGNAGSGSAIANAAATNLTVSNSIITSNTGGTGTLYMPPGFTGKLTIQNSTISNNSGGTGGVYFFSGGSLLIQSTTISNNAGTSTAVYHGGGVIFYGPVGAQGVRIENSTIVNNTTASTAGGGGVNFDTATGAATIRNSTITGNTAPAGATGGGGIGMTAGGLTLTIQNTIVAQNTGPTNPDFGIAAGTATGTNNFIGVAPAAGFSGSGNQTGTAAAPLNPLLGALQNNGGPTATRFPMAGSPVIDTGDNASAVGLTTDQRGAGFARQYQVTTNTVDIGAVEFQPPTVTINQAAAQLDPTNVGPILFTVQFSEAITGFTAADVSFTGSTVGGALAAAITGGTGAGPYTISVTGMTGNGTVVASIPAGGVTSVNTGLGNAASTSTDNTVTFDSVAPTVTINQAGSQADPTNTGPILFTVNFIEAGGLNTASFTASDIALGGTVGGTPVATITSGTGNGPYTISVTGMTGTGTLTASIPAGAVQDLAGNNNTASTSTDNTVTFDNVAPTVTINQAGTQADPTRFSPVVFTVQFTDAGGINPATFTASDISFAGSTVGGTLVATIVSGGGNGPYTINVTGMTNPTSGTIVASIPAGAVTDFAGNLSAASGSTDNTVTYDTVAPTVTSITAAAGQTNPATTTPINFTVTFSEAVSALTAAGVSVTGSANPTGVTVTTVSPTTYTVSVANVTGAGNVDVKVLANAVTDPAGNPNPVSATFTLPFVVQPPKVTIDQAGSQADPTNVASVVFTVRFNQAVTGFTSADVDLSASTAGGTLVAGVTGSGQDYTVTVTGMTSSGAIVVTIPAGAAVGPYSNTSAASTSTDNSVTFDNVAPTATINQASGQADPTRFSPVLFTVQFTDASGLKASTFTASDISFAGSTVGGTLVATILSGSGNGPYTISVTGMTGTGTVVAGIPAGAIADLAGNVSTAAAASTDNTVTFDNQAPTVTIDQAGGQLDPVNAGPIRFTVQFTDAGGINPATFTASDISFAGSTVGGSLVAAIVSGSGNGPYVVAVTGMNGTGTVVASIPAGAVADLAGNASVTAATSVDNSVTFDNEAPTVTINQKAGQADPTNGVIVFDVVFSELVTGFDPSDVKLTLGAGGLTPVVAVGGAGTTYTVTVTGLPDNTLTTVTAEVKPGGTIDAAGNGNVASTSTDNTVTFDSVPPTVTVEQAAAQLDPTRFPSAQYTVVFSKAVTGFTSADVKLALTGTLTGLALPVSVTGSGTTYTVTVTGLPAGGLGSVAASVVAAAATDAAGNASAVSTSTDNTVSYDNDRPRFTITQGVFQTDPTSTPSIEYDVVFSEPVTGFDSADVTLGGTLPGVGAMTAVVTGSGDTYTITVTGMQPGTQGTVVANVSSGVATDAAGNPNQAPSTSDNTVTFDAQGPAVTVTRAATQPDQTKASTIYFTVSFAEPVVGFDAADVVLGGTLQGSAGLSANVTGSGATYTVAVTGMNPGLGTVTATVADGAAFDLAGNLSAPATNTANSVTFDTVAPTVTINRVGTGLTNAAPVYTVTFSEPVAGFTAADVSFAGTTAGGSPVAVVSGSGANYTVTVTGLSGTGNVVASIPSVGAAADPAGNASQPSTSTNNVVPFDGAAPGVTINRAAAQADPAAAGPVQFTVVFTELVTGFDAADVDLSASTVGGTLSAAVTQLTPTTYTVSVTGMTSPGNVVARAGAGAAVDAAGNASGASTSTDNVVAFNNTPPTVTINQASGQADPATSGDVTFVVVFSNPVVGFGPASVSLAGTTVGGALSVSTSGTGQAYTVTVSGAAGSGVIVASIPAGVVTDALGNPNVASTSADHTVRFDDQPPTVTIDQAAGQADPAAGGPVRFTVVFSEPVFGFTPADIVLGGTAAGGIVTGLVGSGTTYTVTVTGITASGTVTASIPAGAVADAAGNPSLASTSTDGTVTLAITSPTATVAQASGQADPATAGPVSFTVVFGAPVTGFTAADVSLAGSTAGGTLVAAVTGSGNTYTVTVSGMTSAGDVVVSIPAGAASDAAGNPTQASTSTDNRVTFQPPAGGTDTTPPVATVTKPAAVSGGPVSFPVKFTEPVTGFTAADVSLAGSTAGGTLVAAVTGSGDTYTVTVTGAASPGNVVISVPAGAAADAAGNPSAAVAPVSASFTGGRPAGGTGAFAVGAGAGAGSQVNVYNPAGQLVYSTTPFAGFAGGARVTVADVTGDGVPDYVAGTGPGAATQVAVIDGATRQVVFTYQPFEAAFTGGVFVTAGDVTGDGKPDLVITPDEGGGPRVIVLRGGDFALVANFFGIADPAFRGGARAAAGDINGDGVADLAVAAGFQGGPRVSVFDGKSVAAGRPANLFGDLFIFDGADAQTLRNGAFVAIGDVNGDGFGDLIGGGGPDGGPRVLALSGKDLLTRSAPQAAVLANFFAGDPSNRGGVPLAVKDLDGDAFADIVTGSGPGAGTRVTAFKGSTLSSGAPQQIAAFDAFGGFNTGVFVG